MEMHFCRLYLLGKCYFSKHEVQISLSLKIILSDAFVSSGQAFREEVRTGEELWQKGFRGIYLPYTEEETPKRSGLALQVLILTRLFCVLK